MPPELRIIAECAKVLVPAEILAHLLQKLPTPHAVSTANFVYCVIPSHPAIAMRDQVCIFSTRSLPHFAVSRTFRIEISTKVCKAIPFFVGIEDVEAAVLNVEANPLPARFFRNDFSRGWRDSRGCWLVLEPSAGILLPATAARSGIRWWRSVFRRSRMF
jgi:hypothetical protein